MCVERSVRDDSDKKRDANCNPLKAMPHTYTCHCRRDYIFGLLRMLDVSSPDTT
jgi:hypothetical protein